MGDRRRCSRAMQMAQYQASLDNADVEMMNVEAKFANSLMQYEHHAESNFHGSITWRSFVQCDREECYDWMMKDYFIERSRYPAQDFRRQFQMMREFFESILNAFVNHDHYFARKIDVVGRQSLSLYQKLASAFQMLANGCSADSTDEYYRLAETTAIENLKRFCKESEATYGTTYICKPNHEDLKRFLQIGILQARWAIVRWAARLWHTEDIHSIMMTCIILHNMIVEDEYIEIDEDLDEDVDDDQPTRARAMARYVEYLAATTYETRQDKVTLSEYMRRLNKIQAPQIHDTLRKDLVEHIWHREGER
ncbi:uncharacterized protein [Malus domestica]|uniref:uncharacterized protein n=1 Tax=Malus domestica TaxID=3750 RepID=UPI003976D63E